MSKPNRRGSTEEGQTMKSEPEEYLLVESPRSTIIERRDSPPLISPRITLRKDGRISVGGHGREGFQGGCSRLNRHDATKKCSYTSGQHGPAAWERIQSRGGFRYIWTTDGWQLGLEENEKLGETT